jgi:hypothetical protein
MVVNMKKVFVLVLLVLIGGGYYLYKKEGKILPYYEQLTQKHVGVNVDLQDKAQSKAHFVGSKTCKKCHKEHYA